MKRTLLLWSCLLFLPTHLYSAELAKDGATGWKIVLPDVPTIVEETAAREMYHRKAQPTVFSARMKGNGFLTPEYGGAVRIINFVHSFYKYLLPAKYYDTHPDWYSEIDGKRKHQRAQLCLTNEGMIQELIKNVLDTLRENPDAEIIDVPQNDWHGFCTCEKWKAVDFVPGAYFWFAHGHHPEMDAIFVDRVVLIAAE